MIEESSVNFYRKLAHKKVNFPKSGQFALTYRCNLNCIHCYTKGSEEKDKELTTYEVKRVLNEIHNEGCIWLCFTGGEPLIRDDFWEIYSYAKRKGFLITIFTNGQLLTKKIIAYLVKSPPLCIEITLNGITQSTYETITQTKSSFPEIMEIIKKLEKTDLSLKLKVNCLKQNKHEIGKIRAFTRYILGKPSSKKYRFEYDPLILPRLNHDKTPCNYRLSAEELLEVHRQDPVLWKQYLWNLRSDIPDLKRDKDFLFQCDTCINAFFIDPCGRLKFCNFLLKFSVDLKSSSFKYGFYKVFPQVFKERFKTDSKCRNCHLRSICYHCPGLAYLETGDEEAPVEYFCELAQVKEKEILQFARQ